MKAQQTYKLLAIVEADRITGPAKNLLEFVRLSHQKIISDHSNIETTVVTYCRHRKSSNPFIEAVMQAEAQIEIIQEQYRFDLSIIPQLRRIVEKYRPDIIQTHSVKSHFLLRLSGLSRRFPWIAFHHGYTATDWKVSAYNYLDRWSLRKPEKIITMNEAFAHELSKQGVARERLTILHNSIKSDWLCEIGASDTKELKTKLGIAADEKMILSVGRLSHEKGMVDLVEAVWYLLKDRPELKVKFVIVGDGPNKKLLQFLATQLGVQNSLVFTGQQHDVRAYYAAADLFLLPSHTEGSPNALLEAMTAQLPIVATKVGGVPEIVSHYHSALLVTPRNPPSLAAAVSDLLDNEFLARRLAKSARAEIIHKFAPEQRVQKLIEIYQQILPKVTKSKIEVRLA